MAFLAPARMTGKKDYNPLPAPLFRLIFTHI